MKTPATDAGRLARATILAVLAAGMLPAQLFGGLLFALEFRRTPMPALTGGGLMFGLGVCSAIAVFLPMALILQSRRPLRRISFALAGLRWARWPRRSMNGRVRSRGRCCSACTMWIPSM